MTYAATGSGTLAYRVVIDGCPYEAVTLASMERDAQIAGGVYSAARVEGLVMSGVRFTIKADPIACKLDVGGIEIKLVDVDDKWSQVFDLEPTATTWLNADITSSATSMTVLDSAQFASSGLIWIDGECIYYASKADSTHFSGLTRGVCSPDLAAEQYHYITDGDRLRTPQVTNWPVLWEGRRVYVYRYDDGTDLSGIGTQIYRGVISSAPRFDGTTWSIGVDHIGSVFEQSFGEDLSTECTPRGIHYTSQVPLEVNWEQHSFNDWTNSKQGGVMLTGFWETQEAFCTDLTTALSDSFTTQGGKGTIKAVSEGVTGWHIEYTTAAGADKRELRIQVYVTQRVLFSTSTVSSGVPVDVPLDPPLGGVNGPSGGTGLVGTNGWGFAQDAVGQFKENLAASTVYYFYRPLNGYTSNPVITGLGGVPRGHFSYNDDTAGRTIYLSNATPVSTLLTSIMVKGKDGGGDYADTYAIESADSATRSVVLSAFTPGEHLYTPDNLPKVRLGMLLQDFVAATGKSIADVLDFVALNASQYQTLGVLPGLRLEDFDANEWHAVFDPLPPMNTSRLFTTFAPVTLADIVREELKAAACFLSINESGKLIPARIRLAAQSETSAIATIDETTLLTDKARISHEVSGLGQVNQIVYKTGFDAQSGEWTGDTIQVRDVSAFGQTSSPRTMQIAQRSQYVGASPLTQPDILANVGSPIFGALAGAYYVDTIDAAASDGVAVGSAIKFDCPYLISETGTTSGVPIGQKGVVGRVGIVIGKEWEAYGPRTRFTVLSTKQALAGYAPAGIITAHTNTSGNTWSLTIDTTYYPSGASSADFFAAGDAIAVIVFDATSGYKAGTVTSVSGNTVVISFGSTWTPGASTWYLTLAESTNFTSSAAATRFCFIGDANSFISYSGSDVTAKVFAP